MKTKSKQIQIPASLFLKIVKYFELGNGSVDNSEEAKIIRVLLREKREAYKRRSLYTKSKDPMLSAAEREAARQEYLDMVGIPEEFRWHRDYKEQ